MRKWAHVVNWRIQSKWAYRGWEDPANRWPLPNVWLGVSVEDRQRKERIDRLRETPAAIRFVSFEPLLEDLLAIDLRRIDWAIWGGESGPKARPCDIEWIRRGMAQAYRDGCRNFVKQLGAHIVASNGTAFGWPINEAPGLWSDCSVEPPRIHVTDSKGGNPSEWPPEFRVREMPRLREPHPPIVQTQKT